MPTIPGYHIVPLIPNLCPKYPTKHEGMLEDPFPLIQSANAVTDPDAGKQLEYKQLINHPNCHLCKTWQHSSTNEFGHLAQGVGGRTAGTEMIQFMHHHEMPPTRRPTYARFVCEIRPQKSEKERTRLTVGGNLIDYPDPVTTRMCDLLTFKMHINSNLSQKKRKYCSFDVKNFYLNTPMEHSEYMKILLTHIPDEIIAEYALKRKVHSDSAIYIEIRKGMYGLPQAGMLANKLLKRRLTQHGYYEVRHTPGYWQHVWRPLISPWSWMILAWAMKATSMPYIYSKPYANIMKQSLLTGRAHCIVALPSNGTISSKHASCLCPDMCNTPSTNFNM